MPRVLLWAALLAIGLVAWTWKPLTTNAVTAAAYGARIACPCRFIAGRELSDCRRDFVPGMRLPGMRLVVLSEDADAKSVTAWVPLLSSQTATFREGQGCLLEPWEG